MPRIIPPDPAAPAAPAPASLQDFRAEFLTAATWACLIPATPLELLYAVAQYQPGQTVAFAISRLQSRRALDRRGLLRKQEREAKAAADSND